MKAIFFISFIIIFPSIMHAQTNKQIKVNEGATNGIKADTTANNVKPVKTFGKERKHILKKIFFNYEGVDIRSAWGMFSMN